MNVLVIGSGGREHALVWKISQSSKVKKIFCAPGNPGTARLAQNISIKVDDIAGLIDFARKNSVDLTVVGPEYPLSLGLVDLFEEAGLRVFGPRREAAKLESSKSFAKEIMRASGVRTAECEVFDDFDKARDYIRKKSAALVLKADGLAAGKGVFVCADTDQACSALEILGSEMKSGRLIIEECLTGKEASFIVATDGVRIVPLAASNDYKRIFDNDQGPNTGGMGTVSPTSNLPGISEDDLVDQVIRPVLKEMEKRGVPFRGFLYAGLMITPRNEIYVLEFNTRLGDPETQVILRRLESDLLAILDSLSSGPQRDLPEVAWSSEHAVCLVQASHGYPSQTRSGDVISGIELAEQRPDVVVFHAGTALNSDKQLVTSGGRVLNITATGATREAARQKAYNAADLIQFAGRQMRRDIAN